MRDCGRIIEGMEEGCFILEMEQRRRESMRMIGKLIWGCPIH